MIGVHGLLILAAAICFGWAAFAPEPRLPRLVPLGLLFLTLSLF